MASRPPVGEIAPTRSAERYEPAKRRTFWLVTLALAIVAAALGWQSYQARHRFTLYVVFHDVDGLRPGAEVRLSGVKVGAVQRLTLLDARGRVENDTPQVQVALGIDRRLTGFSVTQLIHRDAVAVLKREGTLADRIVDILPGSAAAPPVAEGDFIAGRIEGDSRTIALRSAEVNANLLAMRERLVGVQTRLERGEGTLGAALKRRELADQLTALQAELGALEQSLRTGSGFAASARRRLRPRVAALQTAAAQLRVNLEAGRGATGKLLTDPKWREQATRLQARYNRLAERFDALRRASEQSALGRAAKDAAFRRKLQATRDGAAAVRGRLERAEGTAGKWLHDGRLRRELAEFTAELTKTIYDVRLSPFKYIRLKF
ncbi:MAG: MlaD family protein [Chloracidobacterium sp.]|nr:MlaD family protein [Chloracidobacterium sp.]MDW8218710.1 MlaD family protein [Acidobacteriota bacterium]